MAKSTEPLRGEAAFRAAKKEIAERNELAYARGRRVREQQNAEAHRRRLENDRGRRGDRLPGAPDSPSAS